MSSRSIAGVLPRPFAADAGARFDRLATGATVWLLAGLYSDGWAHGNGLPDSFWTVWHAAYFAFYFAAVSLRYGVRLTFTFVSGLIIACGVIGLLLSLRRRPTGSRGVAGPQLPAGQSHVPARCRPSSAAVGAGDALTGTWPSR